MQENMNQTYLHILTDTQKKKNEVLKKLDHTTLTQEALLSKAEFDIDSFNKTIEEKGTLLGQLDKLDEGFEEVYLHVSEFIQKDKDSYKQEILGLQELIREATELNIHLRSLEERNRSKLMLHVNDGKQRIKDFKVGTKTAAAYYKNMSNQHQEGQSYFLDKKK